MNKILVGKPLIDCFEFIKVVTCHCFMVCDKRCIHDCKIEKELSIFVKSLKVYILKLSGVSCHIHKAAISTFRCSWLHYYSNAGDQHIHLVINDFETFCTFLNHAGDLLGKYLTHYVQFSLRGEFLDDRVSLAIIYVWTRPLWVPCNVVCSASKFLQSLSIT